MSQVLVVEDEAAIAELIALNLRHAGYEVKLAETADAAQAAVDRVLPDVVLLDWMLPGQSGLALARRWRAEQRTRELPIIMLTARAAEGDKVSGLDAGADDYLTKPFSPNELLARIRALLRREPAFKGTQLQIADLVLDTASRTVRRGDRMITLTSKEYSLLEFLIRHPNQTLTRTAIAEHVWNYDFDNLSNLIDVHIFALRRKLDDPYALKLLHTVRGIGYRLGPAEN